MRSSLVWLTKSVAGLLSASVAFFTFSPAALAETITYRGFVSGTVRDVNVTLSGGDYAFQVTSGTGDIDIAIFDARGNRLGYANAVGTDVLRRSLPEGQYIVRLRMALCLNPFGSCEANFTAFMDGQPLSFSSEPPRGSAPAGGQTGGQDRALEACIALLMRDNPQYTRTTAQGLCRDIL